MFGGIKLAKNADPDKYSYSGYGIGFYYRSLFSYKGFCWGKCIIIFGVGNSLSVHTDNKRKYIWYINIYDTTITAEAKYCLNFV